MNKIYICCPGYVMTGGIELLHQLVYKLNTLDNNSAVIYYNDFCKDKGHPTPEIYTKYTNGEYITEINDEKDALLILPEVFSREIVNYKNIKIVVWWLSIDNYLVRYNKSNSEIKIGDLKSILFKYLNGRNKFFNEKKLYSKNVFLHLYQSEYARLFLEKKALKPSLPLSDFLNSVFFQDEIKIQDRDNVILYNPQKGFEITKKIIEFTPDYNWIALENLTPSEMMNLMKKSKIYIDFGNHPGKDRIPREAAINGCVIITNKIGSANNSLDIPIRDEYKFDNPIEQKAKLVNIIDSIYSDFEMHFKNFNDYRLKIKNEEKLFENELVDFHNFLKSY